MASFTRAVDRLGRAGFGFALLLFGGARCAPSPPLRATGPAALPSPAAPGSMAPNWARLDDGAALTWWEPAGPVGAPGPPWRLRFARWQGGSWSPAVTVAEGGDYFANWADFPSVAAGADGALYAHWLEKLAAGTYAYGVQMARSVDGGTTWTPLGLLHHDGTDSEHGFVSLIPEGAGVRAIWLDGRETAHGGAMTLRTALVDTAVEVATDEVLDDRICDCCSSAAVVTPAGPLVAYRDRNEAEIRDISVLRHGADGWSPPAPLHLDGWKIPGCPVNGPALAASGDTVWAAWYTGADERPRVLTAVSDDRGLTFAPPVEVDGANPLGRVGLAVLDKGVAALSWLGSEGESGVIRLARLDDRGRFGAVREIARTSSSRGTGVPRIHAQGDEIWLAWVTPGDPATQTLSQVELRRIDARGD